MIMWIKAPFRTKKMAIAAINPEDAPFVSRYKSANGASLSPSLSADKLSTPTTDKNV